MSKWSYTNIEKKYGLDKPLREQRSETDGFAPGTSQIPRRPSCDEYAAAILPDSLDPDGED
jgi:hypothetical protein